VNKRLPETGFLANFKTHNPSAPATNINLRPNTEPNKIEGLPAARLTTAQQKAKDDKAKSDYNTPEAREERIKAKAKILYDYAIADLPTQPTTNEYKLSMNNEFLKKHGLLIPEPQTKDVEVLTYYAKSQKELADAFQYMLDKTDYLSKQDLQNQANSSAFWTRKNKAEGYKGEPSNLSLGFQNVFRGFGKKKRSRRS
jgi:hypothetical protein